jgi:hypothetical protein
MLCAQRAWSTCRMPSGATATTVTWQGVKMKRLAIGLCSSLLLLGIVPASALAVNPVPSQLDQHNDSVLDTWSSGGFPLGQVFTAGKTGPLVGVELYLGIDGSETVTASINGVDSFAQPNSTVLASTTAVVSGSSFGAPHWVFFSFTTPTSVTSGTKYSIVFSSIHVAGDGGGSYAGGAAYGNEGNWAPFAGNSQSFNFRTYVAAAAVSSPCGSPAPSASAPPVTSGLAIGGSVQPDAQVTASPDPCTTPPPTSTSSSGEGSTGDSGPQLMLLICFALGGLGVAAVRIQRGTIRT